ncbi:glycosyltransferase family 4 protein [Methylomarinum vadi]|uniref:glycosyltransferase family 4 protein n=1 Tax=Methylomarinum vadi TaxID=438855 RepID=UPI0004DF9CC5|nr:glycosyltransferase family 4 protein [Methylomarinum vadi]
MNILILQKNAGKAGAQNSLRRLLSSEVFRKQNVLVVTGTQGWFLDQVKSLGIRYISIRYPAYRSLYGKMIGNRIWFSKVIRELKKIDFVPDILQGNNHFEAPFLHLLKEHFTKAKTVAFIRDPDVNEQDYIKYRSGECDIRIAVSQFMHDSLVWDREAKVFNNGVFENEIYPFSNKSSVYPSRWLVLGNPSKRKGWSDFLSALNFLQESNRLNDVKQIVFTGMPSGNQLIEYQNRCRSFKDKINLEFVPFFDNLGEACQDFDLIIQPSRSESFGMALLEACCAGKCVVSSRTGVAEKLILNPNLLFEPCEVSGLVASLEYVLSNWQNIGDDRKEMLQIVRENYSTERNAGKIIKLYEQMLG